MIAASSLFTSCIEQVEPAGIETLRDAKAEYLLGVKQLRLAEAEVQKAQATYWQALAAVEQANAAFRDAQTEGQKLLNEMQALLNEAQEMTNEAQKLDLEQKAAQIAANIETIKANAAIAAVQAQQNLATAQDNLRIALAAIAANQLKLTDAEAAAVETAIGNYEEKLEDYYDAVEALTVAQKALWNNEYDMATWGMDGYYEFMIDYYTQAAALYAEMLENVPTDPDVEAWAAELEKYKDSLDQYYYNRYQVTKDSLDYMVNVYHDGSKAYADAFKEWITDEENPFYDKDKTVAQMAADVEAFNLVAPKLSDYTKPADTLNLPEFEVNMTSEALYVYAKYFQLLISYMEIENPYSKIHTPFITVDGDNPETVSVLAGKEFKDFILGAEDATDLTCYKKGKYDLKAQYGLKGALSTIKRDLVLLETEPDETIEENYNEAKALWEADRDTLIKGLKEYKPYVDAVADTVAAWEALEAVKEEVGNGSKAMVDAIDALVEAWNKSNGTSPISKNDSLAIYNAIIDFAAAREQYLDYTPGPNDSNYFRYGYDMTDGYDSVAFSALEYSGFVPTTTFGNGLYALEKSTTADFAASNNVAFSYVVYQLFGLTMANMISASPVAKFPETKSGIADCINDTQYDAFYGLYKLAVDNNKFVIQMVADDSEYIPAKLAEAEEALAEAKDALDDAKDAYIEVYERFWCKEYPLSGKVEDEYNAKIYTLETFTEPYNVVVFDGKRILYSNALGAILASVDAEEGYYGKHPNENKLDNDDWKDGDTKYIISSVTFGANDVDGTNMTDFAKYMYWKAKYDALTNFEAFQKAVEEIEAWVEECEKAFAAQVEKAAADGQKKYDTDKAAFDKKVAAYKEITGSDKKGAKVFCEISTPDDYEVAQIKDGEWVMGGLQKEWAEEFLPDYGTNLVFWKKIHVMTDDQIYHLETLIDGLDAAYIAAVKVYNTETAVASFEEYVREYGKARADYYDDCMEDYNDALEKIEFYTKQLAQFEAGYDSTQLALAEAQHDVEIAEQAVADALAALKIAEAEYNKVMAAYCPAE